MRKPNTDIQLGLWRVALLHETAIRPIYPGALIRRLEERGHKVPQSVVYEGIEFIRRKGWVTGTGRMNPRGGEYMTITPSGAERLAGLRAELAKVIHEVDGNCTPAGIPGPTTAEVLTNIIERNQAEASKLRAAIVEIDEILTATIGHL